MPQLSRRAILQGMGAASLGLAAIDGLWLEPNSLAVDSFEIPVDALPKSLDGFRLAHITDLHLGQLSKLHDELIRQIDAFAPQLVALTGDIVESASAITSLQTLCAELKRAERSVVAVNGNWEWWGQFPQEALRQAYDSCGVRFMSNESALVQAPILVCAVDDYCAGKANMARAMKNMPRADLRLLLTHSPEVLDTASPIQPPFHLSLAGHTHGGQQGLLARQLLTPPGSGRFVEGFYQTPVGRAFVSRGLGTSVVPARLLCRPQLALFRFHS